MKLGLKEKEIHIELVDVFPGSEPLFDTVARWIRHFNDGRNSLQEEERSGWPRYFFTKEIVARAEAIVTEDRRIKLRFLAAELSISNGIANNIMRDELRRTKRRAQWIPHLLTDDQRAQRVHICCEWLKMFSENGPKHSPML